MLPVDVLHIIISYLAANEFEPLLKFRTICRDWRNIGDRSPIWLNCPLVIKAPNIFLFLLLQSGGERSVCIGIHQDITHLKKGSVRIVVKNHAERSPLRSVDRQPLPEQAYLVSSAFLKKYRLCHKAWRRYLSLYMFLKVFDDVSSEWFSSPLFLFCCAVSTALLPVAAYLLASLPNYATSLTLGENLGFACIYLNGLFYLVTWLLNYLGVIGGEMRYNNQADLLKPLSIFFNPRHVDGYILMESLHLSALIACFALLHCSLSSPNNPVKYSYIILPLVCATLISIIVVITIERLERVFKLLVLSFLCLVYVSVFLVGLYFDSSSHAGIDLDLAFTPLYVLTGILLVLALSCSLKSFWLWSGYFLKGERILSESFEAQRETFCYPFLIFLRLLANFTGTLSSWLIFLLFLNLLSGGLLYPVTLASTLVSLIMIFFLFQIALFGFKRDNLYLQ